MRRRLMIMPRMTMARTITAITITVITTTAITTTITTTSIATTSTTTTITPMLMTTSEPVPADAQSCITADEAAALYRLMTWLSPAFPVGAFSYSSGIEWAVEAGDITDAASLRDWLAAMLTEGSGYCDAVFLAQAHRAASARDDACLREIAELAAAEEYILTIADDGMGKRSSAYDYRLTGRGGKGLVAQNIWGRDRKGAPVKKVAQSFPVGAGDQVMLVTDKGQLIRTPVEQIRIAGRSTGGVWILRTTDGERVVSVARLVEDAGGAMDDNTSAK